MILEQVIVHRQDLVSTGGLHEPPVRQHRRHALCHRHVAFSSRALPRWLCMDKVTSPEQGKILPIMRIAVSDIS